MFNAFRSLTMSFAASLVMSVPAFAHAHLETATPAVDGTVAVSPAALDLHFTEGLNLPFTGVVLEDASGSEIATGEAKLKAGDDQTLIVPLSETLEAGQYLVIWHALSKDGHKSKGTYNFTVTSK